jgi:hypothetical protein
LSYATSSSSSAAAAADEGCTRRGGAVRLVAAGQRFPAHLLFCFVAFNGRLTRLLLLLPQMMGVPEEEAVRLVAAGQRAELLDRVYASFAAFREMHDMVIVHGTAIGECCWGADASLFVGALLQCVSATAGTGLCSCQQSMSP